MTLNNIWRKSTFSDNNGACVEVRTDGNGDIEVRDTKNRAAGTLSFTTAEWTAFLDGAKEGQFDL